MVVHHTQFRLIKLYKANSMEKNTRTALAALVPNAVRAASVVTRHTTQVESRNRGRKPQQHCCVCAVFLTASRADDAK